MTADRLGTIAEEMRTRGAYLCGLTAEYYRQIGADMHEWADRIDAIEAAALLPSAADEPVALAWENPMHSAIVESAIRSGAGKLDGTFQPATGDTNEGHADSCACLRPGDRDCNCHKAHGFDTAEDMEDADAKAKARAQADAAGAWRLVIDAAMASPAWPSTSGPNIDRVLAIIGATRPASARPSAGADDLTLRALDLAQSICDAVPSRLQEVAEEGSWQQRLAALVNVRADGFHGYAVIRDALDAFKSAPVAPAAEGCHKLDTDTQVFFYEQDFYVLSNFSAFSLCWKGLRFDTSEAAYHWEKFPNAPEVQDMIHEAPSAHVAFKLAESQKVFRRADWDSVKLDVMRAILRAKAEQHEYVRRKLLATGTRQLVEDSWRDDFWGWGPDRNGHNWLGRLWMEVRAELAAAQPGAK